MKLTEPHDSRPSTDASPAAMPAVPMRRPGPQRMPAGGRVPPVRRPPTQQEAIVAALRRQTSNEGGGY